MEIIKLPKRQDCGYKLTQGTSNETSINLSSDILYLLMPDGMNKGQTVPVTFTLFRDDFIKALCFIVEHLPLYQTRSGGSNVVQYSYDFFANELKAINEFFDGDIAYYTVQLYYRQDGRIYLKDLAVSNFNIRRFLVEDKTAMYFISTIDNQIRIVLSDNINDVVKQPISAPTLPSKNVRKKLAVQDTVLKDFIFKVVYLCYSNDKFKAIEKFVPEFDLNVKVQGDDFQMAGLFIHTTKQDLHLRNANKVRWFDYAFELKGKTVYLTNQWKDNDDYNRLTLSTFKTFIETAYNNRYTFDKTPDGVFELWENS